MSEKRKTRFSNAWSEAKEIMWAHRRAVAIGLVLIFIRSPAAFVLPLAPKILLDEVIPNENLEALSLLAVAIIVATVVQGLSSFALSQVLGVAAQRAIMDLRKTVQQHITRLPTSFFDSTKSGVLISRIMIDPEGIRNLIGTGLVQLVGGLVTALGAVACLFYISWQMTCMILLVLSLFGASMAVAFTRLRPLFRVRGEINAEVTGRLTESMGGVRVVKAYTAEKREDIIFAQGVHNLFRNVARSITGISAITAFSTVIVGAIAAIMVIFGGRAVLAGDMDGGDLFMYAAFTALVASPLVNLANIGTQLSEAFAGLDRIRDIKRMATEGDHDEDREALTEVHGDISFEDVSFEYTPGVPVLKGVSFDAPQGSTTALVGPSGSGKSTLIGLVMAFHFPSSGRVLLDGKDLTTLRLKDYRSHMGVVLQDNFLFAGTIRENICYARPHATLDEVREVSRIAHCDEFIEQFKDQYDTVVGERGVRLSGGQRQRVAIARAILADPKFLILDEATSSLDSESEALIQDGLESLRKGRTTFVIAHRLSTIRSADQILVIEDGEIVERGNHQELIDLDGRYKQLHDKQYKLEMNRFINPGEEWASEED